MGLYVTYLDCMDCEDKECIQSYGKESKTMENKKQMKTNKCKYGRIMVNKDCTICTMYGRCELTGRGKNRKNEKGVFTSIS